MEQEGRGSPGLSHAVAAARYTAVRSHKRNDSYRARMPRQPACAGRLPRSGRGKGEKMEAAKMGIEKLGIMLYNNSVKL